MNLMDAINQTRLRVWAQQPPEFFDLAMLDADGTLVQPMPNASRASISPMTASGATILS